jgi:thiol-disulfide isomerase/thioredoxin
MMNKMINRSMKSAVSITLMLFSIMTYGQGGKLQKVFNKKELKTLYNSILIHPDSLSIHNNYLDAMGIDNPKLLKEYDALLTKFPKSAVVPYAYGIYLSRLESPEARKYLLVAVERDSTLSEAYSALAFDAQRRGDMNLSLDYLLRAKRAAPDNPNHAFYYASTWKNFDSNRWILESLNVAENFPDHQRGAQALFWLAERSKDFQDKRNFYRLLRESYPADQFSWSAAGSREEIEYLLTIDPSEALRLASEMAAKPKLAKEFGEYLNVAKLVADASMSMSENRPAAAIESYEQIKDLPAFSKFKKQLPILIAKAISKAGQPDKAYNSLLVKVKVSPNTELLNGIISLGKDLNKSEDQILKDIDDQLFKNAELATDFTLKRYDGLPESSLKDFRGKVVLLTYWFPGCGPCRGEFPHFEKVYRKYKDQDVAYLAINIVSNQNPFVLPFLKETGYSFTPLEDVDDRNKGNLDNKNRAPINFLIDKTGKIIFSGFRIDGHNEDELETMFDLLLKNS